MRTAVAGTVDSAGDLSNDLDTFTPFMATDEPRLRAIDCGGGTPRSSRPLIKRRRAAVINITDASADCSPRRVTTPTLWGARHATFHPARSERRHVAGIHAANIRGYAART